MRFGFLLAASSAEDVAAWLAIVGTLSGGGITVIYQLRKAYLYTTGLARRFDKLERQHKVVWRFIMSRGRLILEQKDMPSISPLPGEVRLAYEPIAQQLQALWLARDPCTDEDDFTLEIEAKFGTWIVWHICRRFGFSNGECLVHALDIAREADGGAKPKWMVDS